jgi:uncharacterized membrane-anchored protein
VLLLVCLVASLFVWHRTLGTISVRTIASPKAEMFYWMTILFSQTLGTALGDWTSDSAGFGFGGSAVIFGALLALVVGAYFWTSVSRTLLFWTAFILTRPLGAVLGDLLDKPVDEGGFDVNRFAASAVLLAFMVVCIWLIPQRAAQRAH